VLRVAETAGYYQTDVVFDTPAGRCLEVFPVELLEKTGSCRLRRTRATRTTDEPFGLCLNENSRRHLASLTRTGLVTTLDMKAAMCKLDPMEERESMGEVQKVEASERLNV
jgi:hypothetical protein